MNTIVQQIIDAFMGKKVKKMESSQRHKEHHEIVQKDEVVALEEGVLFEEKKEKITGADPPHVSWFNPNEAWIRNENRNTAQDLDTKNRIDIECPDTSGGRRMLSSSSGPDVSPSAEALGNHEHDRIIPEERHRVQRHRVQERVFPGAVRVAGFDNAEEVEDDERTIQVGDERTSEESHMEPIPPVSAELVNEEEEERHVQDKINQALQSERELVQALQKELQQAVVAEVVPEVVPERDRRWKFVGVFLLLFLVVVGLVLGITLRQDPGTVIPQELIDLLSNASSDSGKALNTPSTPQNKALEWLATDANHANYTKQEKIQRYALATLYYSTKGDSWTRRDKWLSSADVCGKWYAYDSNETIPCTSTGAISHLSLMENNLIGEIPAEIGMLSDSLELLWLDANNLHGTLPNEIASLTKLIDLSVGSNSLIGTFPSFIVNLTNLKTLWLYSNGFTGTIPSAIGWLTKAEVAHNPGNSSLMLLDLGVNHFSGTVPTSIGMFTNLFHLDLSDNKLNGTIPTELGLLSNLEIFDLSSNRLTGTILTSLASLPLLRELYLFQNDLNGTIPTELGLLSNLEMLGISSNQFTGTVPTSLANLSLLEKLFLYDNEFTGSVNALCGMDLEIFEANTCGQDEINCTCCTHCCVPETGYCYPI